MWQNVEREWRSRRSDQLRHNLLLHLPDEELAHLDSMLREKDRPPAGQGEANACVARLFRDVDHVPHGGLLLTLYIYSACLRQWEKSTAYDHINVVLRALAAAAPSSGVP